MNKSEAISALNLFNEKVEKLINSRFIKHIQGKNLEVSLKSSISEGVKISATLPDQDTVDAFVLTLRFFIQNNESSSLSNMSNLYNETPVSASTKSNFNFARDNLNSELNRNSSYNLQDQDLTNREIFDTFIYGGLAHANPDKKINFDAWMQNKLLAPFITTEFYNLLIYFLHCIANIKKVNLETLKEFEAISF